jgi:hypothetical protein
MMDHTAIACERIRLYRLQQRADAHLRRGIDTGNKRLICRAAKLLELANAKFMALGLEVDTYRS